jgi:ubiquitin C-terminal hydrolase
MNNSNNNYELIFKDKGLCGLVNYSNFCYMNASIQCLSNSIPFTIFFLNMDYLKYKDENKDDDEDKNLDEFYLIDNWFNLVDGLWKNNCVISPISFIKSIFLISNKNNYFFHNNQQHDACEFIIFLIEQFNNLLKKNKIIENKIIENKIIENKIIENQKELSLDNIKIIAKQKWGETLDFKESIITTLFYGQFISIIETTDSDKKEISYSFEPFFPLQINIPDEDSTLESCLDTMITFDVLENDNKWFNEKINKYVNAKKKILIFKSPNILMIQLKRFNFNYNNNSNEKKNNLIHFPIHILNFDKYLFYEKNINYRLYAVINHFGNSNSGHYTNCCKNLNNKWYNYDDNNVTKINEEEIINNNAYCLFYQKI